MAERGRKRDPVGLAMAKGTGHRTAEEIRDRIAHEAAAPACVLEPPEWLSEPARAMFEGEAAYMLAINEQTGLAVYGTTDAGCLAVMCDAYTEAARLAREHRACADKDERERVRKAKQTEERVYLDCRKSLKLGPSERASIYVPAEGNRNAEPEF